MAQKNQDTLEKRKREREEQYKRNTVLEEEEELNLELRPLPDDEVGRTRIGLQARLLVYPHNIMFSVNLVKAFTDLNKNDVKLKISNGMELLQ